jgi:hypothetical protein
MRVDDLAVLNDGYGRRGHAGLLQCFLHYTIDLCAEIRRECVYSCAALRLQNGRGQTAGKGE